MHTTSVSVVATFEDGVLRPEQPLPLAPRQKVTVVLQIPTPTEPWRTNVPDSDERDGSSLDEAGLTEAVELDCPTPIEIPRKRPLTLLDPDATVVGEL